MVIDFRFFDFHTFENELCRLQATFVFNLVSQFRLFILSIPQLKKYLNTVLAMQTVQSKPYYQRVPLEYSMTILNYQNWC